MVGSVLIVPALAGPAHAAVSCNSFITPEARPVGYMHVPSRDGSKECILNFGSQGIAVVVLQEAAVHCYNQEIAVDGKFGPATKEAVKNVQRKINEESSWANIAVDGAYGPQTRAHMRFLTWKYSHHGGGPSSSCYYPG